MVSMIKGFANVHRNKDVPRMWGHLQKHTRVGTIQFIVMKAMRDFATTENLRIERNLQIEKNTIEELCNGRFNPGGAAAV